MINVKFYIDVHKSFLLYSCLVKRKYFPPSIVIWSSRTSSSLYIHFLTIHNSGCNFVKIFGSLIVCDCFNWLSLWWNCKYFILCFNLIWYLFSSYLMIVANSSSLLMTSYGDWGRFSFIFFLLCKVLLLLKCSIF